jgi:hypothetical protein
VALQRMEFSEILVQVATVQWFYFLYFYFYNYVVQPILACLDGANQLPDCFTLEKGRQLKEVAEMSMYSNGDMIRPQVAGPCT